ncbi:hypothetical protein [Paraburkholderia fungorum]
MSEPVTSNFLSCWTPLPAGVAVLLSADGVAAVFAAGVLSVVVPAEVPVVAGWLCANAGTAIAADNASSAQIILLMASANALCFIFPLLARQLRPQLCV